MRILLVEDNQDTRIQLERFLVACHHQVSAAGDLRSGIDLLLTQAFDAILTDIALPDGTGYALISEARRLGVTALNIALSAYAYPRDAEDPKITGFDYYLEKPLDCDRLRTLLDEANEQRVSPRE